MSQGDELKCKCGGRLSPEIQDRTPEHEGHVIGRCVECNKPWYFSISMWEMFNGSVDQNDTHSGAAAD